MSTRNLAQDMVFEILAKLPIKSLARFISVCKSWRSSINDSQFGILHCRPPKLLIQFSFKCESVDYEALLKNPQDDHAVKDLSCPWLADLSNQRFILYGSLNGLVLVGCGVKPLYLWNPTTGNYRALPKPSIYNLTYGWVYSCGLGYDKSIGDYKIVAMATKFTNIGPKTIVEVFTLGTNTWRRVDIQAEFNYVLSKEQGGVFLNEALHWPMSLSNYADDSVVVAYNLAEEKFLEVSQPNQYSKDYKLWNVSTFEGDLCLSYGCRSRGIDVWIMREYGDEASWTKFVTITFEIFSLTYIPLCYSRDGAELIEIFNGAVVQLGRYNLENRRTKKILSYDRLFYNYEFLLYEESFVSPFQPIDLH